MNKLIQIKQKYCTEENSLNIMVTILILFLFVLIRFIIQPSFYISIGLYGLLLFSLYYQIMSIRYFVTVVMMSMKIEDKILNEMTYQTIKRKHTITFYYDQENKVRIKSFSCTKLKMRWIKVVTFIHVALKPAWWYRDDVDEIIED